MIEIKNLTKSYDKKCILKNINFRYNRSVKKRKSNQESADF